MEFLPLSEPRGEPRALGRRQTQSAIQENMSWESPKLNATRKDAYLETVVLRTADNAQREYLPVFPIQRSGETKKPRETKEALPFFSPSTAGTTCFTLGSVLAALPPSIG